jgi:hypothetical protein
MSEHGHALFELIERAERRLRDHINHQFTRHAVLETLVQHLDELIAASRKLKDERASLVSDRDAQKGRADKAEADLSALQAQVADDEAKAGAAADEIGAEATAEAPQSVTITAPTTAPSDTVVVQGPTPDVGSTVSGPGVNATVTDVAPSGPGISTVTLDTPTTADHSGDGSETLTVSAPAASAS